MIDELNYIDNNSKFVTRENWLKKNNFSLYTKILNYMSDLNIEFKERVFLYRHKLNAIPICNNEICKKEVSFISYTKGYRDYCSTFCSANSEIEKMKKKDTNLKKYGVTHPMKNDKIKNKLENVFIEKYGVKNPFQNK